MEYVDYIQDEHIEVDGRVEDSGYAVAVGDIAVVPDDREGVES